MHESCAPPPTIKTFTFDLRVSLDDALQPTSPARTPTPEARPRLSEYMMQYTSARDLRDGPHRTTTDGDLIEAETGEYLVLEDFSPENMSASRTDTGKTRGPEIPLPEAKNGATGLDAPRRPKPLGRVLYNYITGSNRPPTEDDELDPFVSPNNSVEAVRVEDGSITDEGLKVLLNLSEGGKLNKDIRRRVLEAMRARWERELSGAFGEEWFERGCRDQEGMFLGEVLALGRWKVSGEEYVV
ncbi:hypothetical protein K458DRAFT_293305 [Lentithecium fluviatile CBS 122367]|uniref:Uncharacterized protein n=1 Tax=Lentithecium fluviatile CBS 122367 TaxID=1168545 RepID=A0A6G1JF52_9PLEO|nr:hypothetical protein K458DRAFT_293305 [Lentithecium fluviatile CBS 122367]